MIPTVWSSQRLKGTFQILSIIFRSSFSASPGWWLQQRERCGACIRRGMAWHSSGRTDRHKGTFFNRSVQLIVIDCVWLRFFDQGGLPLKLNIGFAWICWFWVLLFFDIRGTGMSTVFNPSAGTAAVLHVPKLHNSWTSVRSSLPRGWCEMMATFKSMYSFNSYLWYLKSDLF